jgi:short-subunit dehydrogenase
MFLFAPLLNTFYGKYKQQNYALVTGATTGIGYELAKLFAADGYDIIAVARTEEDLKTVAEELALQYGVNVEVMPKDLFGEDAATELYNDIKSRGLQVDVLVNDAGQGVYGLFVETDLEAQMRIIHLNIVSFTKLTYHFLKRWLPVTAEKFYRLLPLYRSCPLLTRVFMVEPKPMFCHLPKP